MRVSELAEPQPGEQILDLCAAPGGKTTHLSQLMNNKGKVISCDVSDQKLELIKENIKRLKVDNVELMKNDALILNEDFLNRFDKVLVDAPCSGLGIIRRKPDIKYHKSMEDIESLVKIQYQILENASKYLKANGLMTYSTCTVEPMENKLLILRYQKNVKIN